MHVRALGFLALAFMAPCSMSMLGCHGSDDPVARAEARQRKIALAQCQTNIEVFLPGMQPNRPFRVLGPVEGNWGFTMEARFERMRKKACELGADAILDAAERTEVVVGSKTAVVRYDAWGRPITVIEEPRRTVRQTSAIAIAYTDKTSALPTTATPYPHRC